MHDTIYPAPESVKTFGESLRQIANDANVVSGEEAAEKVWLAIKEKAMETAKAGKYSFMVTHKDEVFRPFFSIATSRGIFIREITRIIEKNGLKIEFVGDNFGTDSYKISF